MYSQIRIIPEDQHAQRYLWRNLETHRSPDVYVFQSMMFGTVCSPYSAQMVLRQNALDFAKLYPDSAKAIRTNFYMDDYVDSVLTEQQAIKRVQEVQNIHLRGGFSICNWASNSASVLESIPPDLRTSACATGIGDYDAYERILGMRWNITTDSFEFSAILNKLKRINEIGVKRPTKREVLKTTMSLFDPLGFLLPVTIRARIFIQELWKHKLSWDEEISMDLSIKWSKILHSIRQVVHFNIPRFYTPLVMKDSEHQLHICCDASDKAYGAVAYLRTQAGSEVDINFIIARAKVAPLKEVSIPRMELQAAVLASKLKGFLTKELELVIQSTFLWTDSQVVLRWLQTRTQKQGVFVSNRIQDILEDSKTEEWRWLPSDSNPADLVTKKKNGNLDSKSFWLSGPAFLRSEPAQWPKSIQTWISLDNKLQEEVTKSNTCNFVGLVISQELTALPDMHRFSKLCRLLRTTAWVRQAIHNFKQPHRHGGLTEYMWCLKVQEDCFPKERSVLVKKGELPKSSRIVHLSPFLAPDNLLRVKGRIGKAEEIGAEVKNPILLDPKHYFVKLLLQDFHNRAGHQGQETELNETRQKFWVIQGRQAVRSTWNACQTCKLRRSQPSTVVMGELPAERVEHHITPFTNVGLDYFGPLFTKVGRRRKKRYGCIFTCLSVRAVHLEMAYDLTMDGTLMAIRRFMARRGHPKKIFSDNGTNLRGAATVLQQCLAEWNQAELQSSLCLLGVEWHFNPPGAPHMAGAWERLIRSVKTAMNAILKQQVPTDEILLTVFAEVEGTINSRPLTHVPLDMADDEALTPNHFLIGRASLAPLVPQQEEGVSLRRAWRTAQQFADHFWSRWVKEYLPTLLLRKKWRSSSGQEIKAGDIVLIADPQGVRASWPKGVVVATYPGRDGKVRVVDVQTTTGVLRRPITKLCPIDVKAPVQSASTSVGLEDVT